MSDVIVNVRITNPLDAALNAQGRRTGLPRIQNAVARANENAVFTCVPESMALELGLQIDDRLSEHRLDRRALATLELLGRDTIEEVLISGDRVEIGRSVLAKCDLVIDAAQLSVIPNPKHPNGPVFRV